MEVFDAASGRGGDQLKFVKAAELVKKRREGKFCIDRWMISVHDLNRQTGTYNQTAKLVLIIPCLNHSLVTTSSYDSYAVFLGAIL